jgi:hypothetical protein
MSCRSNVRVVYPAVAALFMKSSDKNNEFTTTLKVVDEMATNGAL